MTTLTLALPADLEQRLQAAAQAHGIAPAEYAVQVLLDTLAEEERRQQTIAMLDAWRKEADDEEDRAAYEELTKALDEDRPSYRKLFPPELKGISW